MPKDLWIDWADDLPRQRTRGTYRKGYPEGLIVHFTAGSHRQKLKDAAAYCVSSGMSYLILAPDGTLGQGAPLNRYGWHAGDTKRFPSKWPGLGFGVSSKCVGVEVICPGKLSNARVPNFGGSPYPEDHCRTSPAHDNIQAGTYYKYTKEQEATLIRLCHWLKANSDGVFSFDYVLGHDEVSGKRGIGWSRKNDPGASLSLSMDDFRAKLKSGDNEPSPFVPVQTKTGTLTPIFTDRLTKEDFFKLNQAALNQILTEINQGQVHPLSYTDIVIVGYLEAALTQSGHIDPNGRHSEGERGIFPWPSRMPGWDQPMNAELNVRGWFKYLSELKNTPPYGFLFNEPRTDLEAARILAAIVHGWGWRGAHKQPEDGFRAAIAEIAAINDPAVIDRVLRASQYKHANTQVVPNRLSNIKAAETLLAS